MPDHAPSHPDFTKETVVGKGSQFAFQFGVSARRDILIAREMFLRSLRFFYIYFQYIIAIIQAVKLAAMAGEPTVLNDLAAWGTVRTVTDSDSTHVPATGKGIAKL